MNPSQRDGLIGSHRKEALDRDLTAIEPFLAAVPQGTYHVMDSIEVAFVEDCLGAFASIVGFLIAADDRVVFARMIQSAHTFHQGSQCRLVIQEQLNLSRM